MADKGKVKAVIKEQGLGQTVEYAFGYLFKQFKVSQLFAMMETNRVHSVRYGKGLKVTIKDFKNSSRLYAEPKGGLGKKLELFHENYLLPGRYQLTTSKGSKAYLLEVKKPLSLDYYQVLKVTGTKSDQKLGRLEISTAPENAKIVIKNTYRTYHKGVQLPVGTYTIVMTKSGYLAQEQRVKISKNDLTKLQFTLKKAPKRQRKAAREKSEQITTATPSDIEVITVTGARISDKERTLALNGSLILNVTPNDAKVIILDVKDNEFSYQHKMALKPGTYRALIFTDVLIAEKRVFEIKTGKTHIETIDLTDKINVKLGKPIDGTVELTFAKKMRGRAKLVLIDSDHKKLTFKRRVKSKALVIGITAKTGTYQASIIVDKNKWELGEITLNSKTKKFYYSLN